MSDLEGAVRHFAQQLGFSFAEEMAQDPAAFKRRVIHQMKAHLPPHRGRPPQSAVTQATELHELGRPWREVYLACIPGYSQLDRLSRRWAEYNLRSAVRSRRNTRLRRETRRTNGIF